MNLRVSVDDLVNQSGIGKSQSRRPGRNQSYMSPPLPRRDSESLGSGSQGMQVMKSAAILLLLLGFLALLVEALT